jgi:hypothetical protein
MEDVFRQDGHLVDIIFENPNGMNHNPCIPIANQLSDAVGRSENASTPQ